MIRRGCYGDAIKECTQSLEVLRPLLSRISLGAEISLPSGNNQDHHSHIEPSVAEGRRPSHHSDDESSSPAAAHKQAEVEHQEEQHDDSMSCDHACQEKPMTSPTSLCWESRIGDDIASKTGNEEPENISACASFLYRDPIEIPIRAIAKQNQLFSPALMLKLSIAVLFNLALSFHMSAVHNRSWNQLERAKLLYEHVFCLHLKDDCGGTILYSMALLNNLGLIYKMSDQHDKSKACFQNLLSAMMVLLESEEAQNVKQWSGLWSNVMPLIAHNNVAGAA